MKTRALVALALAVLPVFSARAGGAAEAKVAVGIVLPTADEPRGLLDEARFRDAFKTTGTKAEILFSQGDPSREKANVESLIARGIKVLIIRPLGPATASAAAEEAHAAGVKVLCFGGLIRDTASVDFSVAFDGVDVGAAQAAYLVSKASGTGNNLYLYAGAASDDNAFRLLQGAWSVLQPRIADGTFVIRNSTEAAALAAKPMLSRDEAGRIIGQVTTNWSFTDAKNLAEANLAAAPAAAKGTVFICAPNDGTARAISNAFVADKDVAAYYVTGQNAEVASLQSIIDGRQSMTVLEDERVLVSDAVTAARAFLAGNDPQKTTTTNNGMVDVPTKSSAVVTVTRDNVKAAVIDSGYWPASRFSGL